jgi:riboflavin biosynthesis pyrimidine reductase
MAQIESRVTIHMLASLDGFIARKDGSVDRLGATDTFEHGKSVDPELMKEFLATIGCYVMGSRTYGRI